MHELADLAESKYSRVLESFNPMDLWGVSELHQSKAELPSSGRIAKT